MGIAQRLGAISDRVTLNMLAARLKGAPAHNHDFQRIGGIRSAQMQAVLSMTPIMMTANMLNAGAILLLEVNLARAGARVVAWTALVCCYSLLLLLKQRKIRRSGWRPVSSSRATGKIVLSSILLAFLWAYPALMIMSLDSSLETTFISVTTAGMITGGALALYPVPFAALSYACILTATTLPAVIWGSRELVLPFAIAITAFLAIVTLSIRRQAGLFFLELNAKIIAERQLNVTQLILEAVSGGEDQFTWSVDRSSRFACDPAALASVLGLPADGKAPATLAAVLSSARLEASDASGAAMLSRLKGGDHTALRAEPLSLINPAGQTFKLAANSTIDDSGSVVGCHGYIRNITKETLAAQKIVKLATRDHLTGLLNYQEFINRAGSTSFASPGAPQRLFLFIDANNLKAINDNFGHNAGDRLIRTIAERLERHLPPGSLLARKGGDEFVALVAVAGGDAAAKLVDGLLAALRSSFHHGVHKIAFSCCIGASLAGAEKSLELLELEADRALYDAKRSGQEGSRFYDEAIGADIKRLRRLMADLPFALEAGLIAFHYQPIMVAGGSRRSGAEALLRWLHPKFGTIPPPEVLAAARSTGLLSRLSLYAIRAACMEAKTWPSDRFVSVNMNASDFQLPDLADLILYLLAELGFSPDRLWLELTESEALKSCGVTRNNIARLRTAGIKIALDDFGSGYSSLSVFSSLAFDVIKIDRTLIGSCDSQLNSRLVLEAVQNLARANGCEVVAEGVETEEELRELLALGYHSLQGFLFDKPLPADIIRDRLRQRRAGCEGTGTAQLG